LSTALSSALGVIRPPTAQSGATAHEYAPALENTKKYLSISEVKSEAGR